MPSTADFKNGLIILHKNNLCKKIIFMSKMQLIDNLLINLLNLPATKRLWGQILKYFLVEIL